MYRYRAIESTLMALDADVICLQEAWEEVCTGFWGLGFRSLGSRGLQFWGLGCRGLGCWGLGLDADVHVLAGGVGGSVCSGSRVKGQ
jgi:hypothetical protein